MPVESLDTEALQKQFPSLPIYHLHATPSTNTLALEAAHAGAATGAWVADEQTAGRGRGGHGWHSSPGDGLYVSVLLRPQLAGVDVLQLSFAAALAAVQAVAEACGAPVDIRWPNDLMLGEKKFGGILTESAMDPDGRLRYAVIGIGLNLNHANFPPELASQATSLRISLGQTVSRQALLVSLLRHLLLEVERLQQDEPSTLTERMEAASTWIRGAAVHVAEGDGYTGVTDGLDAHGLLRVRTNDGTTRLVRHGGVRKVYSSE